MSPIDRKHAGERRHEAGEQHRSLAHARHRQAGLVDRARLVADGAHRQAERGVAQHQRGQRRSARCRHRAARPAGTPRCRTTGMSPSTGGLHFGQARESRSRDRRAEDLAVGKRGGAQRQDVDADADDDLVGAQRDAEPGLQQRHRQHREHADQRGRAADCRWPRRRRRPAKAAVSIMPSRLMLSTPARSLTSSPIAGQHQRHGEADATSR